MQEKYYFNVKKYLGSSHYKTTYIVSFEESLRIHHGGIVCQYLQQSHLKVTVDALHIAQDPLPVRSTHSQHLL